MKIGTYYAESQGRVTVHRHNIVPGRAACDYWLALTPLEQQWRARYFPLHSCRRCFD